ncbi:BTB/POZ and MATH domain-containing protein 1-like [Panicum virgatum]|uniref:BTB/POZ and MATH domain-containing protein 1-like n=1 Tax=Panicum virgatum TaxID=38727 RepID=UPI0019D60931|nr:BTB/POZ and MATH domain-containing protein 1-like [Panicum virgatum]
MASRAGGGEPSGSASAILADTASGYHILRIDAYSRTMATPIGKYLESLPFTVGGHRWRIRYYPNGDDQEAKDYISLFVKLDESVTNAVTAQFKFRFIGNVGQEALTLGGLRNFDSKGADVVFDVAGQTFAAHRCVLAARSPVFSAELFGVMKESDTGGVVRIDDMEAQVFKALLYFIYTDLFPNAAEEDEDVLAQHLLVAADRYNLERLKLLCEQKLREYIDVGTVATILALAEQHHCHGLKKVCFHFLSSPANLKAVVASDGFKHLSSSCPSLMQELIGMLAN